MSSSLRILVTGSFGPGEAAGAYRDAFFRLGHLVGEVDVRAAYRVSGLNSLVNRILRPIAPTPDYWGTHTYNELVIGKARELTPHLVFFCDPIYIHSATLRELKASLGCSLYSWTSRNAFLPENGSRHFYDSLPLYDCHFATDAGTLTQFLANGAMHAEHLPRAVVADTSGKATGGIVVAKSAEDLLRIPARGEFLLAERTREAAEVFREGIEAEFFADPAELRRKTEYYLAHPEERERIARKGQERTRRPDLSYDARAGAVLAYYRLHATSPRRATS